MHKWHAAMGKGTATMPPRSSIEFYKFTDQVRFGLVSALTLSFVAYLELI